MGLIRDTLLTLKLCGGSKRTAEATNWQRSYPIRDQGVRSHLEEANLRCIPSGEDHSVPLSLDEVDMALVVLEESVRYPAVAREEHSLCASGWRWLAVDGRVRLVVKTYLHRD